MIARRHVVLVQRALVLRGLFGPVVEVEKAGTVDGLLGRAGAPAATLPLPPICSVALKARREAQEIVKAEAGRRDRTTTRSSPRGSGLRSYEILASPTTSSRSSFRTPQRSATQSNSHMHTGNTPRHANRPKRNPRPVACVRSMLATARARRPSPRDDHERGPDDPVYDPLAARP